MENVMPLIFQRGQVWHWEDPEYMNKSRNKQVPANVAGTHYSRYVIIAQDPITATTDDIIVIPISSSNNGKHDVRVIVHHLYLQTQVSYAKVQSLFPAHPRSLSKYICTLDPSIMEIITGEIAKMLIPEMSRLVVEDELQKRFGINLINSTLDGSVAPVSNDQRQVEEFVRSQIVLNQNEQVDLGVLKANYNRWCLANGYRATNDIAEFAELFIYFVNEMIGRKQFESCRWASNEEINSLAFRGIRLRNTSGTVINVFPDKGIVNGMNPALPEQPLPEHEPVTGTVTDTPKLYDWTKQENRDQFLAYLNEHGRHATSEQYGLSIGTVDAYSRRFKVPIDPDKPRARGGVKKNMEEKTKDCQALLNDIAELGWEGACAKYMCNSHSLQNKISRYRLAGVLPEGWSLADFLKKCEEAKDQAKEEAPAEDGEKKLTCIDKIKGGRVLYSPDIEKGISIMSNIMRDTLMNNQVTISCIPLSKLSESDFIAKLSSSLYYSLLKLTGVTNRGTVTVPWVDTKSTLIWFYDMLGRLAVDTRLHGSYDFKEIHDRYAAAYPEEPFGIPTQYLAIARNRFVQNLGINNYDADRIKDLLKPLVTSKFA